MSIDFGEQRSRIILAVRIKHVFLHGTSEFTNYHFTSELK